jgi:hypothetical protein
VGDLTAMSTERVALTTLVFILIGAFFWVVMLWVEAALSDAHAPYFHMWFQFLSGNWPPQWPEVLERRSFYFTLALTLRLLLSIAPIAGLVAIFVKLTRSRIMRYIDLISARDALIMREIMNEVPLADRARVGTELLKAFEQADRKFHAEQLPSLFSPDIVDRVRRELYQDISNRI